MWLLMFVMVSCVEELDFSRDYSPKLTVNCVLKLEESTQVVDIKYNAPRNGTYAEVSEAEVLLYADGNVGVNWGYGGLGDGYFVIHTV